MVRDTLSRKSITHKQAIMAEFKRRDEKAKAEQKEKDDAAEAKARRQERRKCLREQKRINEISDLIVDKIMPVAVNKEYTIDMPIYDVRDYPNEEN